MTFNLDVVGQLQRNFCDHADAAIATDSGGENILVFVSVGDDRITRGRNNFYFQYRRNDRAVSDIPTVAITETEPPTVKLAYVCMILMERSCGSIPVAGHATDARLDRNLFVDSIEMHDLVEFAHVDVQAVLIADLSAHAEAPTANRDWSFGCFNGVDNFFRRCRLNLPAYLDRVDCRYIVDSFVRDRLI